MLTQIIQSETPRKDMIAAAAKFKGLDRKGESPFVRHTPKVVGERTAVAIRKGDSVLLMETSAKGKDIQVISDMSLNDHEAAYQDALKQLDIKLKIAKVTRKPKVAEKPVKKKADKPAKAKKKADKK